MDENPGKVIDGTARARHWRRSQPRPTAGAERPQDHSEAPKSIASSLLVPPAMLDGESVPLLGEEPAEGDGRGSWAAGDENGSGADHRNIFLSPEAAVKPPPPRRRAVRFFTAARGLARRARTASGRLRDIRGLRPRFSRSPSRGVALLGLAGACALAAALTLNSQPTSPRRSYPVGGANNAVAFARLNDGRSFLSSASPFRAIPKPTHPHASDARRTASRSTLEVRHVRKGATPAVSASASSQTTQISRSTSTVARASAVTNSASSVPSSTPANDTSAQQSAMRQAQEQAVHYQPPSQPAGPAGLGSQVGSDCNPKCS